MKKLELLLLSLCLVMPAGRLLADTADTIPFVASMLPANEVPPTTVIGSAGAIIWVHVVRDSTGAITRGAVDFDINYKFPGVATITGLHIHNGAAGVNGNIVIPTDLSGTNTVAVPDTGKGSIFKQVQFPGTPSPSLTTINDLLANPQNYYVNIHTTDNPGGAMRGQLSKADMTVVMGLMNPGEETPPIVGSQASAIASVTVLRGTDASGNFTTAAVIFDANYAGFADGTTFTGFHIHKGAAGVAGPVIINTGIGAGANSVPAGGGGTGNLHYEVFVMPTDATYPAEVGAVNGLFDNPNGFYINLHDTVNPGGEIRAQLRATELQTFWITLLPANETPPITGLPASAPTKVSAYVIRNADGSVAAGTVIFDVDETGFPAGTVFTGLHIHEGAAGVAGSVTINTGLSASNSVTTATGSGNIFKFVNASAVGIKTLNNIIFQNPEGAYVNLHTTVNPGGAIREQLVPANTALPSIGAVRNAADVNNAKLTQGEIISIYGPNLSKLASGLTGFYKPTSLPTTLDGVSVTVAGFAAPLYYVSSGQINAQVPVETVLGPATVVVKTPNGSTAAFSTTIVASSPGLFFDAVSKQAAILKNIDFSLVTSSNPAAVGDVILVYSTGLGQTTPPLATGSLEVSSTFNVTRTVTATVGGKTATVIYSIASPGFAGLYQTAIFVPDGVTGKVPVVLTEDGQDSNAVDLFTK